MKFFKNVVAMAALAALAGCTGAVQTAIKADSGSGATTVALITTPPQQLDINGTAVDVHFDGRTVKVRDGSAVSHFHFNGVNVEGIRAYGMDSDFGPQKFLLPPSTQKSVDFTLTVGGDEFPMTGECFAGDVFAGLYETKCSFSSARIGGRELRILREDASGRLVNFEFTGSHRPIIIRGLDKLS